MASTGRAPFDYQREAWRAYLAGRSGLVHAPTGTGKTLAAWMGPVAEAAGESGESGDGPTSHAGQAEPLRVLWVTPLRALANDIAANLAEPIESMGLRWSVELRTGDVSSSVKARQKNRLPTCLVTTPESLSLLLSHPNSAKKFATLRLIVVDEWHEFLGTKRGVQVELTLARLRRLATGARTWGLSATVGNLDEAMGVLIGNPRAEAAPPLLIRGPQVKRTEVRTLLPESIERFPWYGHLGVKLQEAVAAQVERAASTLLFTNTRSQAELWFQALQRVKPDWVGQVALHHGSIERGLRREVEMKLAAGTLRCVVCTSSLDLGVDFRPVDQVMQVGSPKGVARLLQRAGRSGHAPGRVSRIVCVPTHAFELVEFAATRRALADRRIETRSPLRLTMDVLAQHLVTVAAGGGFVEEELLAEVRSTHAFAELSEEMWQWAMQFVTEGGATLGAYPRFKKVVRRDGRCTIANDRIARQHRLAIGTITADAAMTVRFTNGRSLGTIEESFIAKLSPGDRFIFAGRNLELTRVRQMTAYVKTVSQRRGTVPRWAGARFPLSTQLAGQVRALLGTAGRWLSEAGGEGQGGAGGAAPFEEPEMRAVTPLLALQARWSALPDDDRLLIETTQTRDGHHLFFYPFAGRLVHEGLGALLAHRLAAGQPLTVTVTANDYGIELLSPDPLDVEGARWAALFDETNLLEDLAACVNTTQMARRYFRDIARIAGLIYTGYPGEQRAARHLQASSELFFDVFQDFDPRNLLLDQARREVLEQQLEWSRLRSVMRRIAAAEVNLQRTDRLTPLAFPLYADRLRSQHVSSEQWQQRIARIVERLERAAE